MLQYITVKNVSSNTVILMIDNTFLGQHSRQMCFHLNLLLVQSIICHIIVLHYTSHTQWRWVPVILDRMDVKLSILSDMSMSKTALPE